MFVACRAAQRVLPIWSTAIAGGWGFRQGVTGISIARCILTSEIALKYPSAEIKRISTTSATLAMIIPSGMAKEAAGAATLAATTTAGACGALPQFAVGHAINAVYLVFRAASDVSTEMIWKAVEFDLNIMASGQDITISPLWPSEKPFTEILQSAILGLLELPGGSFWIDWYRRTLDGRPRNWDLLRDIALINGAIWHEGGEQLDTEINRIVERHSLLEEVRRLKSELVDTLSAPATAMHRSHNNPPELVEDAAPVLRAASVTLIARLNEAEEELKKTEPSPSRLRRIGQAIKTVMAQIASYCTGLGDIAIKEAAKQVGASIGKWGLPAAALYFAAQSPRLQELADALITLAGK